MRRTTVIGSALIVLSLAFAPLTDALRYDGQRQHLQKERFVSSLAAPSERLTDQACVDGLAAGVFPCSGIDLLSFVPDDEMFTDGVAPLGAGLSDIWGWTSPDSGDNYVFFGKTNGTAFYRVTDPTDPVYLGEVPNPGPAELVWHDIKVNDGYAYIVSETPGHGVQVVDLSMLDGMGEAPVTPFPIPQVGHYAMDGTAHNIVIDEDNDTVYLVGSGQVLGLGGACTTEGKVGDNAGLHAIDVSVPNAPVYLGCHVGEGYVHDAHCVEYHGPDVEHQGKPICVTAHEDGVAVVDVTDITAPVTLSDTATAPDSLDVYPDVSYSHQGWLSEDHAYYFHGDELDENGDRPTRTFIFDLTDLDRIALYEAFEHQGLPGEGDLVDGYRVNIDHNMYTHQGLLYQSDYEAGLRVFDYTQVGQDLGNGETGTLREVAHFDTYPESNLAEFNGTWSNYPYFADGTIAVSGIGEGLFLLKLDEGLIPGTAS
ncbi:MAG: choice-of-anchor B family protein [Actinobacteria bacterium]|nr:choice-of-anchor B family protein [Actinomycetota bacterium]